MNKILTTQNAEITTAAVQIKTLTVTGKQVTLAVFRQLLEEPLLNRDGSLCGIPWGTVNYHPDGCKGDNPHWHVVWQKGTELRRSKIFEAPEDVFYDGIETETADMLFSTHLRDLLSGGNDDSKRKRILRVWDSLIYCDEKFKIKGGTYGPSGLKFSLYKNISSAAICAMWVALHDEYKHDYFHANGKTINTYRSFFLTPKPVSDWLGSMPNKPNDIAECFDIALKNLTQECGGRDAKDIDAELDEELKEEISDREGYLNTIATIPALPHLFIAV